MAEAKQTGDDPLQIREAAEAEERLRLIEHFSSEIQFEFNNTMTQRIRSAFAIWVGPYVVLGSILIATKGAFSFELSWQGALLYGGIAVIAYLGIGVISGRVEERSCERCNELRKGMLALCTENTRGLVSSVLPDENLKRKVLKAYVALFILMGFALFAIVSVAATIRPISPDSQSPAPAQCAPSTPDSP